jgi:hypothetical protein
LVSAGDVSEVVVMDEVVATEAAHLLVLILKHFFAAEMEKEATVNRALDGSTYPG